MSWFGRTPLDGVRWVVVDCETSGLDPRRDRLLSVGAVEVSGGRVQPARAYAGLLRQKEGSDAANIVIHGIGGDAQLSGRPGADVLHGLARFLGEGFPVAFHAPFDEEVLRRAAIAHKVYWPERPWLDLAAAAPALFPRRRGNEGLDEWLEEFGIAPLARHDALGDAFAEAQVLLVLLAEAARRRIGTLEALMALAR